ncbi:MAG: type II toxin-antitoxin system RelE/ParE family toxin [Magnetococcales bacterium]|nr:type II toxin-antitoxin system RelE/ParE family toxin [Magnetococcales bacterium]
MDWVKPSIVAALFRLAHHPLKTSNVKPLVGGGYRLRVGNHRVLYTLKHDLVVILVIKVGHRRDVYR